MHPQVGDKIRQWHRNRYVEGVVQATNVKDGLTGKPMLQLASGICVFRLDAQILEKAPSA